MWKLTIEDDEQKQISLPLVHNEYGVGRDEANEIRLTERNISRKHAAIRRNSEGWVLRDLESYNGTYVNGLRVAGEQHVTHGDIVQLGDYRLEFVDEGKLMPAVPEQSTPQALPPHHRPDRLVVVVGPQPGQEFYLDREHFSMGRSEDADISVNHSSVSRFHAELFAVGNGRYEIIDKGSANGIRINGQEVRRGFIEAGDALELGDVRLRFVGAGKIFRAGLDHRQALPAITGFDAAIKGSGTAAKAASPGSSILKMVAVGAVLGVIGVGAVGVYVATKKPQVTAGSSTNTAAAEDAGKPLLEEAKVLHGEGKLDEAHDKIALIPEGSEALKDPAVATIEAAWADKLFKEVDEHPDDPQKQVDLLWKIRNNKHLDDERRKKAQSLLKSIGVEVPEDMEDVKPNAPAPTFRPQGTFVPKPSATASTAPRVPGQEDRDALNNPDKKYLDLKSRPLGSLNEGELMQLIGLCQSKGDPGCAQRAAKRLQEVKANPAPSAKKP